MRATRWARRRQGSILPLVVISLVAICGFVALGIDIGLITLAKTQLQNAVDAAAMGGARSIDGSTTQNIGAVGTAGTASDNVKVIAQANKVLSATIPASALTTTFGAWHYDTTNKVFVPQYPPVSPDNYNLCSVSATLAVKTTFAPVFKIIDPSFISDVNVTAVAVAAHRPRDVSVILDYSGSMNNESDLWNNEGYLDTGATTTTKGYQMPGTSNPNLTSNNVETVYPFFGHYANEKDYTNYMNYANLLSPTADSTSSLYQNKMIGKCNIGVSVLGVPAMVGDYYQNAHGATTYLSAFTLASDNYAYGNDANQGDNYLPKPPATISPGQTKTPAANYAKTVSDVVGGTAKVDNWETKGYKQYNGNVTFKGYTLGPRYWGKTFFIWPPDPTNDWRSKFFFDTNGTTPMTDNTGLFQDNYPGYLDPATNYVINYKAILNWIKNTGTNPFPTPLRAGNVLFYDSIPTDVPASVYDHTKANSTITDANERFWKEYIDYVLGVWRDPAGNINRTQKPACSMGPDYVFGTVKISTKPTDGRYMDYQDNPWRPRHRMWFGPMTMIQFISDTGKLPGTAHDISMYPMKIGVGGALTEIKNNHPNDLISMILFNRPQYDNDPPNVGGFNSPQYNLNNDFTAMLKSLWLPPNSSSTDVRLWTADGNNTPRAFADWTSNTASSYGFMLAYNQFSGNSDLKNPAGGTGDIGGFGRKGATKLVIYETDGMANQDSVPVSGFQDSGAYNSYYRLLPNDTLNGAGYSETNLLKVVEAICNKDDKTVYKALPTGYPTPPSYPGYATSNKPVIIECIAFGAIFETSNSTRDSSVAILQKIATIGGTVFPSSSTDATNGYKWCIGTIDERKQKLKTAFKNILTTSIPVSLIQ